MTRDDPIHRQMSANPRNVDSEVRPTREPKLATLFRPLLLVAASGLAACSVPVHIDHGSMSVAGEPRASEADPARLPTVLYAVRASLPRSEAEKFDRWELYFYIQVVNCRNWALEYAVAPHVGNLAVDSHEGMARAVRESRHPVLVLTGSFEAPAGFERGDHCLTLDGGSYLLQKIDANVIPAPLVPDHAANELPGPAI